MSRVVVPAVVMAAAILCSAAPVAAQTLVWQTQPFCNRLTLTLTGTPAGFTVVGTDDGCGAPRKATVTGTIVLNPDGTAGLRVSVVSSEGGRAVDLWATVSTANGSGSWADGAGHSGALALGSYVGGLPTGHRARRRSNVADSPMRERSVCFTAGTRDADALRRCRRALEARRDRPARSPDLEGCGRPGPSARVWSNARR